MLHVDGRDRLDLDVIQIPYSVCMKSTLNLFWVHMKSYIHTKNSRVGRFVYSWNWICMHELHRSWCGRYDFRQHHWRLIDTTRCSNCHAHFFELPSNASPARRIRRECEIGGVVDKRTYSTSNNYESTHTATAPAIIAKRACWQARVHNYVSIHAISSALSLSSALRQLGGGGDDNIISKHRCSRIRSTLFRGSDSQRNLSAQIVQRWLWSRKCMKTYVMYIE